MKSWCIRRTETSVNAATSVAIVRVNEPTQLCLFAFYCCSPYWFDHIFCRVHNPPLLLSTYSFRNLFHFSICRTENCQPKLSKHRDRSRAAMSLKNLFARYVSRNIFEIRMVTRTHNFPGSVNARCTSAASIHWLTTMLRRFDIRKAHSLHKPDRKSQISWAKRKKTIYK